MPDDANDGFDRMRLAVGWVVVGLYVILDVLGHIPALNVTPPDYGLTVAFGAVTMFLFGPSVVKRRRKP